MKKLLAVSLAVASITVSAAVVITHPQAYLVVLPPSGWLTSYCTISLQGYGGASSWATEFNGEECRFSYLNHPGTYTITVFAEGAQRGLVTSEQYVVAPLPQGSPIPTDVVQMVAE